jgi:hypothetical protein
MVQEASNTFTTIREKFHPIALVGGRQYAAYLRIRKVEGRLYVSEHNQWLWSPLSSEEPRILTDRELEELVSPLDVCRTLLFSAQDAMNELLRQIDCVHEPLTPTWTEPGRRYADEIISGIFQLKSKSGRSHSMSTAQYPEIGE